MQQLFARLLRMHLHPHLSLLLFRSDAELSQWFPTAPTLPGTPSAGWVLPSASTSGPSSHMTAPVPEALAGEMCLKGVKTGQRDGVWERKEPLCWEVKVRRVGDGL